MTEKCDVVVVGARLAGSSAAAHLARAGLDVVVIDRSSFPSDQLSTHLLFPDGVNEVRRMGALDGILAHEPTRSSWLDLTVNAGRDDEVRIRERWRNAGPIDYCLCVPRIVQDHELVKAARAAGADVRERHKLVEVLWKGGRACGIRYADREGIQHDLLADVVLGADGRRSSVASEVDAFTPYRASRNGRGLVWRYADDPLHGTRQGETIHQWRDGESMAFLFPSTPAPRMLVLFMGAAEEAKQALADPEEYWQRKLNEHPGVAARTKDATNLSDLRATGDTTSYFRASSGPGWALIGDAGHFKDPVLGQGQRDALWSGRRVAEQIIDTLGDPAAVDLALRDWERERDEECLHAYHFGNTETEVTPVSPVFTEVIRRASDQPRNPAPELGDLYGRARTFLEVLSLPRVAAGLAAATRRAVQGPAAAEEIESLVGEVRTHFAIRDELAHPVFRSRRVVRGSDHPDPCPPTAVRLVPRSDTSPSGNSGTAQSGPEPAETQSAPVDKVEAVHSRSGRSESDDGPTVAPSPDKAVPASGRASSAPATAARNASVKAEATTKQPGKNEQSSPRQVASNQKAVPR